MLQSRAGMASKHRLPGRHAGGPLRRGATGRQGGLGHRAGRARARQRRRQRLRSAAAAATTAAGDTPHSLAGPAAECCPASVVYGCLPRPLRASPAAQHQRAPAPLSHTRGRFRPEPLARGVNSARRLTPHPSAPRRIAAPAQRAHAERPSPTSPRPHPRSLPRPLQATRACHNRRASGCAGPPRQAQCSDATQDAERPRPGCDRARARTSLITPSMASA
jgi:hypothetical protein